MKLSQKGIWAKIAPLEDVLYSQLNTLWLQVHRRIFLPSYTQNTTLFAELYGKKCFWLSIFGSEIIPKRYLSQNRPSQALAIAKGSTLWLQVLRRMFLPSYTQNTTLFAELYEKKCRLVRAAMLGLVFTGDCLVYYVRSLSSLTPTRKKNKLPQRFAQKLKNAWLLARFARSRKIDLF